MDVIGASSRPLPASGGRWVARVALALLAFALTACATLAGREAAHTAAPLHSGETVAAWPGGIMLPAGQRAAVLTSGDSGWILTLELGTSNLILTTVSLSDGGISTAILEEGAAGSVGGGLASDGAGHLWITYAQEVMRVDEQGGAIRRWSLPQPPPDATSSDENLGAGNAEAAVWDEGVGALLLVRNGDHRLYRFDDATGTVSVVVSLPITTSYVSRIAISADESIVVTGSETGARGFSPSAVRVSTPSSTNDVLHNILAACTTQLGLAELTSTGDLTVSGLPPIAISQGTALPSNVPFACDPAGDAFTATVANGRVTVDRLSAAGVLSVTTLPLTQTGGIHGFGGTSPYHWLDPRIVALLPDGAGGAWLVSEVGTQTIEELTSAYPSMLHVGFPH